MNRRLTHYRSWNPASESDVPFFDEVLHWRVKILFVPQLWLTDLIKSWASSVKVFMRRDWTTKLRKRFRGWGWLLGQPARGTERRVGNAKNLICSFRHVRESDRRNLYSVFPNSRYRWLCTSRRSGIRMIKFARESARSTFANIGEVCTNHKINLRGTASAAGECCRKSLIIRRPCSES